MSDSGPHFRYSDWPPASDLRRRSIPLRSRGNLRTTADADTSPELPDPCPRFPAIRPVQPTDPERERGFVPANRYFPEPVPGTLSTLGGES